jgi:dihydrodipicolinate synthase/N-acetylneuraminate lyase
VLEIVRENADKVDGVKVSLLDAAREVAIREQLPDGVRLYTGDDFNYPELIASGSDALLGIFGAIAPAAAAALQALERGDRDEYDRILGPTVPLARKLFEPPTFNYKTGIAYLAHLNGHQEHFRMLGGMETARSPEHLAEVRALAERAGLVPA